MKKTSFVVAILFSAALIACGGKNKKASTMNNNEMGSGSATMGSDMGSGSAMGSDMGSAMGGSGSAM